MLARLSFLAVALAPYAYAALQIPPTFENSAVLRTVELGGSTTVVTTSFTTRSLASGNSLYYIALPRDEDDRTTWLDVKVKGKATVLPIQKHGLEALLHKSE